METVLVPLDADLYAVPIGWVREVVATPALSPLVTAPQVVLGLFNLRGEIVPLLDIGALLGLSRRGATAYAVVLLTHLGPVALNATGFPRRAFLEELVTESELTGCAGTYRVGSDVAVLLDIQALIESAAAPTPSQVGSMGSSRARGPESHALAGRG
jgi:chemotaxis signal transduction protein